jgi:hypothetical protein
MQQQVLERALVSEAPITEQELLASEAAWLINSLGCRLINCLD